MKPAAAVPLVTLATTDYAGITRGRSMTRRRYEAAKGAVSCGWVPANMSLTPFDLIAEGNPWGSKGDLRLVADKTARFQTWPATSPSPLDLVMCDITELDGSAWTCCPRAFLKAALQDFTKATGSKCIAAFEQEFQICDTGWPAAPSFAVCALRRAGGFAPELMGALEQAGVEPELIVAEYGRDQYELTTGPAEGVVAADRAVVIREVVREMARDRGWRASFAPKTSVAGVGNGVHVHFSFVGPRGKPTAYDATQAGSLSALAQSFCAGVLRHLPALVALTAGSPISGLRLQPHNWSSSYTWLGEKEREATLRICPVVTLGNNDPGRQFNIEYRAADATACPHLVLGAIIRAGLAGVRDALPAAAIFDGDPQMLDENDRHRLGLRRLPQNLPEALEALASDAEVSGWFSKEALATYIGMKRMELKLCEGLEGDALCTRYAAIY